MYVLVTLSVAPPGDSADNIRVSYAYLSSICHQVAMAYGELEVISRTTLLKVLGDIHATSLVLPSSSWQLWECFYETDRCPYE